MQEIAVEFADRLCRERPLTSYETDLLCKVVGTRQERVHRLWTAKDDRELMQLSRLKNAREVAAIIGRTPYAVRSRKRDLRARSLVIV